jgi:hypothetical protein
MAMAEPTKLLYANADKTKLVPEDSPDARYVVNPNDPGEFADLVEGQKAQAPVEDKAQAAPSPQAGPAPAGFEPNPPGSPERKAHEAARRGK